MHMYLLPPTVKVRGQPGSPSSIGAQGWHSGLEVWRQVPLSIELSHWPAICLLVLYKSWHVPECMSMILFSYFVCVGCNHAVCTFWVCHFHLTCYCQTHPCYLCVEIVCLFLFLYNFPLCGYTTIYLKDWSCLIIGSSGLNMLYSGR